MRRRQRVLKPIRGKPSAGRKGRKRAGRRGATSVPRKRAGRGGAALASRKRSGGGSAAPAARKRPKAASPPAAGRQSVKLSAPARRSGGRRRPAAPVRTGRIRQRPHRPPISPPAAPPLYPSFIGSKLDLLHRFGVISREQWGAAAARTAGGGGARKTSAAYNTDVLMFYSEYGRYRPDYQHYFYPVADQLIKRGRSVTVLAHQAEAKAIRACCPGVKTIYIEPFYAANQVYAKAAHLFRTRALGPVRQLCGQLRLNAAQASFVQQLFQRWAIDWTAASILLQKVKPRLVYGIHYILNAGSLDAIKAAPYPIVNLLIQHGFFGSGHSHYHDFRGADQVLLWGDYHRRILARMTAPPPAVVIGNPKLEFKLSRLVGGRGKPSAASTILYISSGSPLVSLHHRANLEMFLEATRHWDRSRVLFKLHPCEKQQDYAAYVQRRSIVPQQFVHADLFELIHRADIVAGSYSTGVFEAAAVQRPVIQLHQPGQDETHLLFEHAANARQLQTILDRLAAEPGYAERLLAAQNKIVRQLFGQIDGAAAGIAAHIIKRIGR